MKVCLINPPHPYLKQPTAQAPLGLMYVASSVAERGVNVKIVDISDRKYDDPFEIPEADLYGITGTVIDRTPIQVVAKFIKKRDPSSKVIVGGPISLTPQYLDRSFIDSVVVGEGEHVIHDILNELDSLKPTYVANRIIDLDKIPFPARHLIDNLGGNIFAFNKNYRTGGSTVIITSRGCPYQCAFCASPGIWKRRVIFRSAENVLDEIDQIINEHHITQLRFSDDTFTLNRKRLIKICNGLKSRNVIWRASIRSTPNDIEMLKIMYDSGCKEISIGVESGDPDVLLLLKKGVTVEDHYKMIMNAKKVGMVVRILFMIGTPGETEDTVDHNIRFLEELHYDTIALTTFIPIPGCDIAINPHDYGCKIINSDIDDYNFYLWGPSGQNKWSNLIELDNITNKQLKINRQRMIDYVISTGKSNMG